MLPVLLFVCTLFLAVLLFALSERTVLSSAVWPLLAGLLAGPGVTGVVGLDPASTAVPELATLALSATLFPDGMRVGIRGLAASGPEGFAPVPCAVLALRAGARAPAIASTWPWW